MPIEEDERGTAILSSRDICMMEHLPRLMESGVCCFKIEGRMKTEIYIATVVGAYRRAMDAYAESPAGYRADAALQRRLRGELDKTMDQLLSTLNERQQQILRLHFGMEDGNCYSLEEIGKKLSISKERVRQIERQAMDKLQKMGTSLGLEDFLNE